MSTAELSTSSEQAPDTTVSGEAEQQAAVINQIRKSEAHVVALLNNMSADALAEVQRAGVATHQINHRVAELEKKVQRLTELVTGLIDASVGNAVSARAAQPALRPRSSGRLYR